MAPAAGQHADQGPPAGCDTARPPFRLRARYVCPVASPPIDNGVVTISGDSIAAVGPWKAGTPAEDLGDVAILPGFVNAHTHLEFSQLPHRIGHAGIDLVSWIELLLAQRSSSADERLAAIETGLGDCLTNGVTGLGEIAQPPGDAAAVAGWPIDACLFLESIAPVPERLERAERAVEAHIEAHRATGRSGLEAGLNPHAPYSVAWEFVERLAALAAQEGLTIVMHLAESREEIELLRSGSGRFRGLLERLDAWRPNQPSRRPLDYLRVLSCAPRSLVVHGTYLASDELAFLAEQRDRMAVVYCGRSHGWFDHAPYPLEKMLAAGVRVALGTDSRASAPDLSVLAEARHIAQKHPTVRPSTIVGLATLDGAAALGWQNSGALVPGRLANLAIVPVEAACGQDAYEAIIHSGQGVAATWYRGKCVYSRQD